MRRVVAKVVWVGMMLGLFSPSMAQANFLSDGRFSDESYFNPGLLLGAAVRDGRVASALGAELSLHHFTQDGTGMGAFGQWQWMAFSSHRFCAGGQVTSPVYQVLGLELGVAHETGDARHAGTTSVHVAPFFGYGVATLSLRFGIPFHSFESPLPRRGFEAGLNLALKFPSPVATHRK
ncbi:hypothetical protein [Melittangium boletus]|uniref:Outer membrane protein beta-barrel domain-containing protein n=1 Tax=Melittangium boletus DSM 14713 TaxID=1294270 RepID=A0A250I9D4_9BACT|nr:hypothetical protein [Melittangium boletus]ATB27576.1 hypothetical protein MEBOL_001020 [Melittangium boletus DSM 14713]